MVRSILDKSINYEEIKSLADKDKNVDVDQYVFLIDKKEFILAFGLQEYDFEGKGIVYFPIYLINNNIPHTRVGVYEIFMNTLPDVRNEDGDIDIEKLGRPLFFSYFKILLDKINKNELMKLKAEAEVAVAIEETAEAEAEAAEVKAAAIETEAAVIANLNEKNKDPSVKAVRYNPKLVTNWVQRYLKDNNYGIVDVEKNGNCLFAVIRDAFKSIGKIYTVDDLRNMLANEVTENILTNYKSTYKAIFGNFDELEKNLMEIKMRNQKIKEVFETIKDKDEQNKLIVEAHKLQIEFDKKIRKYNLMKESLQELEYLKDVKDINTIEEFKSYIKSRNFWGESWAINTLERVLNIKLILLSEAEYKKRNLREVLYCGDEKDSVLEALGTFSPEYYIFLDHIDNHFKLITYNKKGIFTFKSLPINIKNLMKNKCAQERAGVYSLIEDLKKYTPIVEVTKNNITDKLRKTRRKSVNTNRKTRKF